jgi:hypothetical protein
MDVKTVFFNGDLVEEVYVKQSPGFAIGRDHQVLKLNKTMYGLWQASGAWYLKLHSSLTSLEFTRNDHERAIYTRCTSSKLLVIGVYVDDLLIAGPVDEDIEKFKQEMREQFKMIHLRLLTNYLSIDSSIKMSDHASMLPGHSFVSACLCAKIVGEGGLARLQPEFYPNGDKIALDQGCHGA